MLRGIRNQVLNIAHDVVQKDGPVDESAEARDLASNSGSHFGLVILKQLGKGRNQIPRYNLLVYGLCDLYLESENRAESHAAP